MSNKMSQIIGQILSIVKNLKNEVSCAMLTAVYLCKGTVVPPALCKYQHACMPVAHSIHNSHKLIHGFFPFFFFFLSILH